MVNGPSNDNIRHTRGRKLFEALVLHDRQEPREGSHRRCYLRRTHPGQFDRRHKCNLHIAVGFDVVCVWNAHVMLAELCGWRKCPAGQCNRSISFGVIISVQKTLNTIQLIDTGARNGLASSALAHDDSIHFILSTRFGLSRFAPAISNWWEWSETICVSCCACQRTNCMSKNLCNFCSPNLVRCCGCQLSERTISDIDKCFMTTKQNENIKKKNGHRILSRFGYRALHWNEMMSDTKKWPAHGCERVLLV